MVEEKKKRKKKDEPKKPRAKPKAKPKAPKKKKEKAKKVVKKVKKVDEKIKINIYSLDGTIKKKFELPEVFRNEIRTDMIKRAVDAFRANRRQRYGPSPLAGMRHSVETWGKGRGVARVQRIVEESRGAQSPGTVGGRKAHPPKAISWHIKLNRKERKKAKLSALAATADPDLVKNRGHLMGADITLPVVVEDKFEELKGTKDVIKALKKLKLYDDVLRAEKGTHIRAGRGKMRSRRYRVPKSILIVLSEFKGVERGLKNLPGVEVSLPNGLNAELLAPGGVPGRLTVFTEGALEIIRGWHE